MRLTSRRAAALAAVFMIASTATARADGAGAIAAMLDAASPHTCREAAASAATKARLARTPLPSEGKLILVNIASQTLTAYEDGDPVLEMKVVVGSPRTPTPEMRTEVTFVRFNPTWTVPASILREPVWRERVTDAGFLAEHGFTVADGSVVQEPGEENALGLVKFGLSNANAIYLHDTNERERFDEARRTLSHGCVRLEDPFALAAWVLGIGAAEARAMQESGDESFHKSVGRVPVVLGYFTAWPDSTGRVHYFRDVYGKDGSAACPADTAR